MDLVVARKANSQEVPSVGQPVSKSAFFVMDLVGEPGMADFAHRLLV
jgi:hypothetical protein